MRPQPFVIETSDFAERIVSTAMGVAGDVIQRLEFAEDGHVDRGAEGLFQFIESGDLATQQQRMQFIGAEGEGSHNVIVPVVWISPVRNYNKSARALHFPAKTLRCPPAGWTGHSPALRFPGGEGRL